VRQGLLLPASDRGKPVPTSIWVSAGLKNRPTEAT
jgi:hypothetical protein